MKYAKRQLWFFIGYLAVGVVLIAAALLWAPADRRAGIVSGLAGGFLVTGVGGIVLSAQLLKNPEKAEKTETAKTEERARFLREKTQSSVHSVSTMLVSAGAIASMICGNRDITLALCALLVAEIVLYVCFGVHYAKKY